MEVDEPQQLQQQPGEGGDGSQPVQHRTGHAQAVSQQQTQQQQYPPQVQGVGTPPADEGPGINLAAAVVPHAAVEAYVWSVVRHLVPAGLLGDAHNRQVLRQGVKLLVRQRRHETVNLATLVKGLTTSGMAWLQAGGGRPPPPPQHQQHHPQQQQAGGAQGIASNADPAPAAPAAAAGGHSSSGSTGTQRRVPRSLAAARQRWLAAWVGWLVEGLVLPLLRNSFYVTESEPYRQQVFYYRWVPGAAGVGWGGGGVCVLATGVRGCEGKRADGGRCSCGEAR